MTKRGFRPVAASQLSSRCPMSPEATKNSLSSAVQAELPQKVPWLECIEASAETGGSNQHPALLERQGRRALLGFFCLNRCNERAAPNTAHVLTGEGNQAR